MKKDKTMKKVKSMLTMMKKAPTTHPKWAGELANAMLLHAPFKSTFYSTVEAIENFRKEDGVEHYFDEPVTFH